MAVKLHFLAGANAAKPKSGVRKPQDNARPRLAGRQALDAMDGELMQGLGSRSLFVLCHSPLILDTDLCVVRSCDTKMVSASADISFTYTQQVFQEKVTGASMVTRSLALCLPGLPCLDHHASCFARSTCGRGRPCRAFL